MEFIPSDAETDEFRSGEFIKLSDCPPDFEPLFTNARKVGQHGRVGRDSTILETTNAH